MTRLTPSLMGWVLFLASSLGFIVSSYRSGDVAALAGSVLFLAGCVFFLLPVRIGAAARDSE